MNVSTFGKLNIGKPATYSIPWGGAATPTEDPFREAEMREVIDCKTQIARSYVEQDNKSSDFFKDLDSQAGRVLGKRTSTAKELQGGTIESATSVRFDPATKALTALDVTSRDQNLTTHALWKNGEFQSLREERVLADGKREVLDIAVNSGSGTLTCTTQVLDKV